MPSMVVKPVDNDEDFYILWSTVVDAPTAWGTQAELMQTLMRWGDGKAKDADRFARARATGTSMLPWKGRNGTEHPGFFAYGDTDQMFIVEQRGLVRREDLVELCRCYEQGLPFPHILHPFSDGHIVGWPDRENA